MRGLGRFGDAKLTWSFLGCGSVVSFWVLGDKFLGMRVDLVVFGMQVGGKFLGTRW